MNNQDETSGTEEGQGAKGFHYNIPCRLHSLVHLDDYYRISALLDKYIWQRFVFDVSGDNHVEETNMALEEPQWEILTMEEYQRLRERSFENLCKRLRLPTLHERETPQWEIILKDTEDTLETDSTSQSNSSAQSEERPVRINRGLKRKFLPAWFINSAVFSGCPALLRHLLPSKKGKEVENNTSAESDNAGGAHGLPVEPDVPSESDILYIANARVACEFPLTDTWINRGTLLIMSPLHFACWRHDLVAIKRLLEHGADPNALALESVDGIRAGYFYEREGVEAITEAFKVQPYFKYNGAEFYKKQGLSPLHFLALGLRCPPKHSLLEGSKAGIIHDICAAFRCMTNSESDTDSCCSNHDLCLVLQPQWHQNLTEEESICRSELLVKCIETLLEAGANPNAPWSCVFKGAYPLDIFIQPPIEVYYSPSFARGDMEAVTLRWRDLEYYFHSVMSACNILVSKGAKVSASFISKHQWRPVFLDPFRIRDLEKSVQLIKHLLCLGLFSGPEGHQSIMAGDSTDLAEAIKLFIANIVSMSVSPRLIIEILRWCPAAFHNQILNAAVKTKESLLLDVESTAFNQIFDIMRSTLQFRSLKHHAALVILESLCFSHPAIDALPLPPRLKRELKALECL